MCLRFRRLAAALCLLFALVGATAAPVAAYSGLSINNTQAVAAITATTLAVRDARGGVIQLRNVSVAPNIVASGANGLDTGTRGPDTWYAIHVIYNPATNAVAGLFSRSEAAPALPPGHTHAARVGWTRTDGAANMILFNQKDNAVWYRITGSATFNALPQAAFGMAGSLSAPIWAQVQLDGFLPGTAAAVFASLRCENSTAMVAPNTSYGAYDSTVAPPPLLCNTTGLAIVPFEQQLESGLNLWWASDAAGSVIYVRGYRDNL